METRVIPGYQKYVARSDGAILNETGKLMSSWLSKNGRPTIIVADDQGRRRQKQVDRLVALAFLDGPPARQIQHLDGDLSNCAPSNLTYIGDALDTLPMNARPIQYGDVSDGYFITADGLIISSLVRSGHDIGFRVFSQWINDNGYACVTLRRRNGKLLACRVHVLLATMFHGRKPFEEAVVRHLDGDKLRNVIDNISWGTPEQNSDDAFRHGRYPQGEESPLAKLTDGKVLAIRSRSGESKTRLAREFGVSTKTIKKILDEKSWRHLLSSSV